MIPRQLIPRDVRPPAETPGAPPRRLTTLLDDRELVPGNWPHIPVDAHTSIPEHMPLDVLASRVVVPRDMPHTALDSASLHPDYDSVTVLDHRVAVPSALPVVELQAKAPVSAYQLPDVLDADVMNSGEANLMVEPIEAPAEELELERADVGGFGLGSPSVHPVPAAAAEALPLSRADAGTG